MFESPLAGPANPANCSFNRARSRRGILLFCLFFTPLLLQACFPLVPAAGMLGGALVASDRRTVGAQTEDESIEWKSASRVNEALGALGEVSHINYTSYDRKVLITGEVPDEATKTIVAQVVLQVENVVGIYNELRAAPASSFLSRSNDSLITTKVKSRLVNSNSGLSANHVKVITEDATVYLFGIVTHNEADVATRITSRTSGVKKVVSLLDARDEAEIRKIQNVREESSEELSTPEAR